MVSSAWRLFEQFGAALPAARSRRCVRRSWACCSAAHWLSKQQPFDCSHRFSLPSPVNLAPVNMGVRCTEDQAEAPKAAEHEEPKRRLSSGVDYQSEEADEVRRLPHR